ncbi:MAG: DEAD/DEAH box helicase family protein [Acidimicrobiales bacterium]
MELDPRRTFSRDEVWRSWQRQSERCNHCGRSIPFDLMHGDHMLPWSLGGRTTMDNLQALCASCNLRKGNHEDEVARAVFDADLLAPSAEPLRRWQERALPVVLDRIMNHPVLVEACPGAGKTRFALEVVYKLVEIEQISRVLVVAPTLAIVDGWSLAASASDRSTPTMPLLTQREWRATDMFGDKWLGAIITYQSLFAGMEMFLAHATDPGERTLVIFDEVHHAGANRAWGKAAQEAFARGATGILSMSGTPFRTNCDPIVFVPSKDGNALPDFRYSYDEAIADNACRPIQFVEARGTTTFRTGDDAVRKVSFDDSNLTDLGERRRLRAALTWVGENSIAEKMLRDANDYLLGLRASGDSDAAGLVVCMDCDHAARVADFMDDHVIGFRPIVACSRLYDENDPDPANAIRHFRGSHDPWLVAVGMVSEGVDITRLRAVVYLTNRLTLLSFRQIVGRVVRTDPRNRDDHGRVYLPADPRLLKMARHVTDQVHLLPLPIVIVTDGKDATSVRVTTDTPSTNVPFETISTTGVQGGIFDTDGHEAQAELVRCARLFIEREGLTGTDAESLALAASGSEELRSALLAFRSEL